jgi:signal transduction histidine kinase/CheY-like chemotaxis protein
MTRPVSGISTRLNLLSIGLILLTAVGITGYFVLTESRQGDLRLIRQGETVARALAQTSEFGIYTEDNASLGNVLRGIDALPGIAYAAIRDSRGRVLLHRSADSRLSPPDWPTASRPPAGAGVAHRDLGDPASGRRFIDLIAPVATPAGDELSGIDLSGPGGARLIGYVQVGIDRESEVSRLRQFVLSAVAVTAALVLVGIGLTLPLTRRLAAPLRSLADFTRSVSDDRLDRAPESEGPAEIRQLAAAFNDMLGRLKASRDKVAEQAEALDQLRQSQKMEAVGQLAGGIAHDFNNLMTVVLGQCELLLRKTDVEPLRGGISEIARAGKRAASLTRQLLAFGRRQMLQPKVLDLNVVVGDVHVLLRRLAGDTIDFRTNPGSGLWPVLADPGQIEHVLVNLVLNARDAMPDGGTISLGTRNIAPDDPYASRSLLFDRAPGHVLLCVTDTGVGMDEATRKRMFEPFFTTKEVGKGTGLGLSSVYGTVMQSGGFIDVESVPGAGTTINIYLPRTDRTIEPASSPAKRGAAPSGKGTVLLVEDGGRVRALVRDLLADFGYTVLEAAGGADALRVASGHAGPIDLMLSDVVMPGMNGRTLKDAMQATRPEMKVLFMSAHAEDTVLRYGISAGSDEFIQKPFNPEEIGWKVHELLRRGSSSGFE